MYAVETIATGIAVKEKKLDAVQIGVLSMIWTGILMLIISSAARGYRHAEEYRNCDRTVVPDIYMYGVFFYSPACSAGAY